MGQAPSGDSYNEQGDGLPLIAGAGDFSGSFLSPKKYTTSPQRVSRDGDIILSIRASIGAKVWADGVYCLGRGVASLRPGPDADPRYLWHWLSRYEDDLIAKGRGATFLQVNKRDIAEMPFAILPLPKQKRIAAILDQADEIRAKRRAQLAHLDELPQALFHEMFGDASTFKEANLGTISPVIDNGNSPKCETHAAGPNEWGVLKLGAVTYGTLRPEENKAFLGDVNRMLNNEVRPGDVLMTRKNTRELVGAVSVAGRDTRPRLLLPDLIFRLHLDLTCISTIYFQTLMMTPTMRIRVRGLASGSAASMPNISKARLKTLLIPLPPLAEQQAFAKKVEAIQAERSRVARALDADDELFAALQHCAFRGEL